MVFNNLSCHRAETSLWMRTTRWNFLVCKHSLGRVSQFQGGLVSVQWKQDKASMNVGRTWVSLVKKEKSALDCFPSSVLPTPKSCLVSWAFCALKVGPHNRMQKLEGELASCAGEQNITLAAPFPDLQDFRSKSAGFCSFCSSQALPLLSCVWSTWGFRLKCVGIYAEEDTF